MSLPLPSGTEWASFWARWTPREQATLLFVRRGPLVLLIEKKRGLGAGKVNAPGGRIEQGETAVEAAIRETIEEVGVRPIRPSLLGRLRFQFVDGHSIQADVFVAAEAEGEPVETSEATPFWAPARRLPYDRMWADDRVWLPHVLAGRRVDGWFWFDGDTMLQYELRVDAHPPEADTPPTIIREG